MERHFDDELRNLKENLIKMAALTEEAIYKSVKALEERNKVVAQEVIVLDEEIDELENKIEESSVDLLALFQPMAKDLRFITTGMKINAELERIADLCVNICQRVIDIADQPILKPLVDIPLLAGNAQKMVKDAIDAFIRKDKALATEVIFADRKSNELRNAIMKELIEHYMVIDGRSVPRAVALLLVTRDLERISDHATNIAEDVIYMVEAKVIKHHLASLKAVEKTELH
jgi:phosphate transport system protein